MGRFVEIFKLWYGGGCYLIPEMSHPLIYVSSASTADECRSDIVTIIKQKARQYAALSTGNADKPSRALYHRMANEFNELIADLEALQFESFTP